ncbi:uncharacterized protein LOC117316569 isoform X2 [Pecten maximus]|uniref:uncharacterized protein LOC117316569 isoform X2 n=1 Tax=Pecten maximus TaxID=6579 RepID=UPI001458959F|nr:uncharacterized protein LOC117316569 isoform X2 [Pecten maximus]
MRVLVAVLCVTTVWGYRYFQDEIPNGAAVPHPCKTNFIWWGVGHLNPRGGGSVNPFGEDFKNAGMKWTRALCEMDSDGDGETNGQELGDPDCVWTKGSVAAVTKDISHPGVCTPYSDPACQAANTWIDCKLEDFHCDAFSEEGAKNISLRIPRTVVPPSETSYYCVKFPLPTDVDYHIVGLKPLIDNENVVHHIIMYGCDDSEEAEYNQPEPCGMYTPQCTEFIFGWGLGSNGICLHTGTGVRLGKTGFKKVMLQEENKNFSSSETECGSEISLTKIRLSTTEVLPLVLTLLSKSCLGMNLKQPVYSTPLEKPRRHLRAMALQMKCVTCSYVSIRLKT